MQSIRGPVVRSGPPNWPRRPARRPLGDPDPRSPRRSRAPAARSALDGAAATAPFRSLHRSGPGSGSGPGAKRSEAGAARRGAPAAAPGSCPRGGSSSKAQALELVATWSVPSRAIRAGHAFAAIAGPTALAATPATTSASAAAGPKRASSRRTLGADRLRARHAASASWPLRASTSTIRAAARSRGGSASCDVAVIDRLAAWRQRARASAARRSGVELREDVVEKQERRRARGARRAGPPRQGGARARPCAARPASRSRAGRGRRRGSATSRRCGPSTGRPALEVAVEPLAPDPRR